MKEIKVGNFINRFKNALLLIFAFALIFSCIKESVDDKVTHETEEQQAINKAQHIVDSLINSKMTEFEKILVLHEYITSSVKYGMLDGKTSAYTALVHNQADCVGFARGLDLLFSEAGLTSFVVVRKAGHLWVKVMIDNTYYNIDPTWCALKSGWPQYSWFLLNDEQNIDSLKGEDHKLTSAEEYTKADKLFEFKSSYFPNMAQLRDFNKLRIMGTISLPNGETAPERGVIGFINSNRFKIPYGKSSVFYISYITRDNKDSTLSYTLLQDQTDRYAKTGYYSQSATVIGKHAALDNNLNSNDITNINLTILPVQYRFNGEISLPDNELAPKGGIYITMTLTELEERTISYWDKIYIPEGSNSASFILDISDRDIDKEFYLYYWSSGAEEHGYVKYAYYTSDGTTSNSNDKEIVNIANNSNDILKLKLVEK
ncbi:MAG: hypothetical protein IPO21_14775 [Bacteroidales bacterium]|nr:hypothetical protein [Bacteroidales bacterium]